MRRARSSSPASGRRAQRPGPLQEIAIAGTNAIFQAAQVLTQRGEQPRNIPFGEAAVKKLVLNQEVAKALGMTFPPDIVQADSQCLVRASTVQNCWF